VTGYLGTCSSTFWIQQSVDSIGISTCVKQHLANFTVAVCRLREEQVRYAACARSRPAAPDIFYFCARYLAAIISGLGLRQSRSIVKMWLQTVIKHCLVESFTIIVCISLSKTPAVSAFELPEKKLGLCCRVNDLLSVPHPHVSRRRACQCSLTSQCPNSRMLHFDLYLLRKPFQRCGQFDRLVPFVPNACCLLRVLAVEQRVEEDQRLVQVPDDDGRWGAHTALRTRRATLAHFLAALGGRDSAKLPNLLLVHVRGLLVQHQVLSRGKLSLAQVAYDRV